ncbi:MAG: VacJ family lipoprotein [Thermodesulfovibrionales bacterium]|nr:VacJ family lipoprotein [Thermodesulfovibrionales bacterium]
MKQTNIYLLALITCVVILVPSLYADSSSPVSESPAQVSKEISGTAQQPKPETMAVEKTSETEAESEFSEEEGNAITIADPLYPLNKAMYHFNDKLYFWILKPVAKGYSSVMPEDIRIVTRNFFSNLMTPVRFVSSLLQLRIKDAGNELVRFVYNSTAGVLGLADAAKADFNIVRRDEDVGQALGSYGIGHGFYIVWPFIGPSSLRDTVGLAGDYFLDPVSYVNPTEASFGIMAYDEVNETSLRIGDYEDLKKAAIDPYVSIRNAYIQHRQKKVDE